MARPEEASADRNPDAWRDGMAMTRDDVLGAQFYMEDLLGRPVDLVTDKALRAELRPHVEREAIHV